MNLPVQHLSDEAVAAFADGVLRRPPTIAPRGTSPSARECAAAVDEQRVAASLLRAAPAPSLPAGLLDRLRAVPVTTPLRPQAMALAPDGSAVFPAFGTAVASVDPVRGPAAGAPARLPPADRRAARRLAAPSSSPSVAVAAAMLTVGLAASASADTGDALRAGRRSAPAGATPCTPGRVLVPTSTTNRAGQLDRGRQAATD